MSNIRLSWASEIPKVVKNIRDTLLSFLAGCLTFAPLFAPRLHMSGEDYAMWIGFIMLAIGTIAKGLGVKEDVKESFKASESIPPVPPPPGNPPH
jgi:hypothetical protein